MENPLNPEGASPGIQTTPLPIDKALEKLPSRNGIVSYPRNQLHELPAEEEDGLNLREIWRKLLRRKWLVLAIVLLGTTITAVQVLRMKSIYQATATIEIGKDVASLVKSSEVFYLDSEDKNLQTALFLLRSRPLLEDVVTHLRLDQNPRFKDATPQRSLLDVLQGRAEKSASNSAAEEARFKAEEAQLETKAGRTREESQRLAVFVSMLKNSLTVDHVKGTRLVSVSFDHIDPELTAEVATGVAQVFIERSFRQKTQKYTSASDWLDTSTRKLETQMRQAEQDLADYTRANGIFSEDEKKDLPATKLALLHEQAMRAETELLIKQSLYEEVRQGRVAQLPEAFANTSIGELQKRLSDLNITMAQMSLKFDINHPRIIEIREQITAIEKEIGQSRKTLEEKLKADYERAARDKESLTAALNRAKGESLQQNQKAIQYNILKQNAETARQLYTNFLQKTSQADVEKAQQERTVTIAEPAEVPRAPIAPLRGRIILFAFVLSLAGAIGLVFLLDHLDNTVKSVDDVSRFMRLPALGVIPKIRSAQDKILRPPADEWSRKGQLSTSYGYKTGDVSEAYRTLRTSVLHSSAGHPPQTLLVTSSRPSEGKTTTTINVAVSLAQLGLKVIIVDADMRRPRVHKAFELDLQPGLSTYLSSEVKLEALLHATETPNVWVISAGAVPPNPAELVSSEKMRVLLRQLSSLFDHVLIDTPPVLGVSDAVILSRLVDGVMLVVQGGKSTRQIIRQASQELLNVGAKIIGVVLNDVNIKGAGYDQYYYQYSSDKKLGNGK